MSISFDGRVGVAAHFAEIPSRAGASLPENGSAQARNELAQAMTAAR